MNTPYNKDRIVDDGWKSVVLNSFKSLFWRFKTMTEASNPSTEERPNTKRRSSKTTESRRNSKNKPSTTKQDSPPMVVESDITIISLEDQPKIQDAAATTSKGLPATPMDDQKRNKLFQLSSTDSESDVIKSTPMKSYCLRKWLAVLA